MKIVVEQRGEDWTRFEGTKNLDPRKVAKLVEDGIWTADDLAKHGLDVAEVAEVPEGKRLIDDSAETFVREKDGTIRQVVAVEDKPVPEPEPELTPAERLERRTGLTVSEIKTVLGLGGTRT